MGFRPKQRHHFCFPGIIPTASCVAFRDSGDDGRIDALKRQPLAQPAASVPLFKFLDLGERFLVGDGEERHLQTPQRQLKKPVSFLGCVVVLPLRNGACDDVDLPRVQPHAPVHFGGVLALGVGIGKEYLAGGRFPDNVKNAGVHRVGERLRRHDDGAIILPHDLQPLPDLLAEDRMPENNPRLVKHDGGGLAVEGAFDPAEQAQQYHDVKFIDIYSILMYHTIIMP